MRLNDSEKHTLEGKNGTTLQKSLELLVRIGETSGADDMVGVSCAHILAIEITDQLYEIVSEMTKGLKTKVITTTHALPLSRKYIEGMQLPASAASLADNVIYRLEKLHKNFGAIPSYTCLPYSFHYLRLGEHAAFTDSQIVPLANAWFGIRTNMESPASAIASALSGKSPRCGLHLSENRWGEALIDIDDELQAHEFDYSDYGALSYWAGKIRENELPLVPVYKGLSPQVTLSEAKYMCLPHTWHSGSSMFHVVGVTPEAPTAEVALGWRKAKATAFFGKKQLDDTYNELISATESKVDIVCIGCPHCTLQELHDIANLLDGKKVHRTTRLWVGTNWVTRAVAKTLGYIESIEGAGGLVISDACVANHPVICADVSTIATNAVAPCKLVPLASRNKTKVWFGRTADCINAAINGRWEAN